MTQVARLEILHYRHTLASPIPTVMGPMHHRPALLLRVEDDEGACGWGEIWCNFPPGGDAYRAQLAGRVAAVALRAGEASDTPFIAMIAALRRLAIQSGEPGPMAQIASGLDIALTDMAARRAGVPLAAHLGGKVRDLPAYASGVSPDLAPAQVERMRGKGYSAFKQRIGFGAEDSIPQARDTASGLHPGEQLMLDANQAWDLQTARTRAEELAALDPVWLEEPTPADTPPGDWAALSRDAPIPLAAGENVTGRDGFAAMISGAGLKFLQPDICKWGGLTETCRIAREAEAAGLTYCPHFLGGGVGLLASAHLLSAVGGAGWVEVDSSENPLLEILSGGAMTLVDGRFRLPDGPGLGPDPDLPAVSGNLVSRQEVRP